MYYISALLLVLCIAHAVFDAISDAHIDETGKRKHWMQSSMIVFIVAAYYLQYLIGFDPFFIVYLILIRYSLFDTIYNDIRGLDLNYTGNTNHWYARMMDKIPGWVNYISRPIAFMAAFFLAYLYYKYWS